MQTKTKTLTISQLIDVLQSAKKEYGDLKVILSSDPEGNSYGTIGDWSASFGTDLDSDTEPNTNFLTIYPLDQFLV